MKITMEHIEQVFFEYFEGNLTSSEEKELFAFLELHPDLFDEFNLYKSLKLNPSDIHYTKKDLLKKNVSTISDDEFETLCIRFVENDLSRTEETKLKQYIKSNPEKERILNLYLKTKLLPDISENYSQKQHLKKSTDKKISLTEKQAEALFIASAESILTREEKQSLTNYLTSHPEKENELYQYQKIKLTADTTITYSYKNKLKKIPQHSKRTTIRLYGLLSAAASVLIALMLAINFNTNKIYTGKNLAVAITKMNTLSKKTNTTKLPIIHHSIYYHSVKQKTQKDSLQKEPIQPNTEIINPNYAQQEIEPKDTAIPVIQPLNQFKQPFTAEKNVPLNDSLLKEGLDQLFAQNKFHYFHDMMNEIENEKQAYLPNHNGGSLWSVLESGSKKIREVTGSNIVIKEDENNESRQVKQIVKVGNFSFSRTFSRK
jgi:hypothetical protein